MSLLQLYYARAALRNNGILQDFLSCKRNRSCLAAVPVPSLFFVCRLSVLAEANLDVALDDFNALLKAQL